MPPPLPPAPAPQVPAQATSRPVDTLQYGNLSFGMTEAAVVRQLGPPDTIHTRPRVFVRRVPYGPLVEVITVIYVYAGGGRLMDTYLTFENGVLVDKAKRR